MLHVNTHRILYVFGCNTSTCANAEGSWTVCRATCVEPKPDRIEETDGEATKTAASAAAEQQAAKAAEEEKPKQQAPTFGGGGDWDSSSDEDENRDEDGQVGDLGAGIAALLLAREQKGEEKAQAVEVEVKSSPPPPAAASVAAPPPPGQDAGPCFKPFCIVWGPEPEAHEDTEMTAKEKELLEKYELEQRTVVGEEGPGGWNEEYEEQADKVFQKFAKRVNRQPYQCVRYAGGGPLVYNENHEAGVPACACGKERVFEMQLMPNLYAELRECQPQPAQLSPETAHHLFHFLVVLLTAACRSLGRADAPKVAKAGDSGMDWGTIEIFTCPDQECGLNTIAYEAAIVHNSL